METYEFHSTTKHPPPPPNPYTHQPYHHIHAHSLLLEEAETFWYTFLIYEVIWLLHIFLQQLLLMIQLSGDEILGVADLKEQVTPRSCLVLDWGGFEEETLLVLDQYQPYLQFLLFGIFIIKM